METRAEYFKSEWKSKFEELVQEEIKIRARAAEDLAEEFDIEGITIQPGCNPDGSITILDGMDKLLACFGLDRDKLIERGCLKTENVSDGICTYRQYFFRLPDYATEFKFTDTDNPISGLPQKEKVMPYDEV